MTVNWAGQERFERNTRFFDPTSVCTVYCIMRHNLESGSLVRAEKMWQLDWRRFMISGSYGFQHRMDISNNHPCPVVTR